MKIFNNIKQLIIEKMSQTKKIKSMEIPKKEEEKVTYRSLADIIKENTLITGSPGTTITNPDYLMWTDGPINDPTRTTMINNERPTPANQGLYNQIRNDGRIVYSDQYREKEIPPKPRGDNSPTFSEILMEKQRIEYNAIRAKEKMANIKYGYPPIPGTEVPSSKPGKPSSNKIAKDNKRSFDEAVNEFLKKSVSIKPQGVRIEEPDSAIWVESNDAFNDIPYKDVDNKKTNYENIPEDLLHDLNLMFSDNKVSLSIPDSITEISKELNVLREILVDNVKHTKTSDEVVSSLFDLLISLKKTIDGN